MTKKEDIIAALEALLEELKKPETEIDKSKFNATSGIEGIPGIDGIEEIRETGYHDIDLSIRFHKKNSSDKSPNR